MEELVIEIFKGAISDVDTKVRRGSEIGGDPKSKLGKKKIFMHILKFSKMARIFTVVRFQINLLYIK